MENPHILEIRNLIKSKTHYFSFFSKSGVQRCVEAIESDETINSGGKY